MIVKRLLYLLLSSFWIGSVAAQNTYNLLKDARAIGNDCYQLTRDVGFQTGVVWYRDKLNLNQPFDIEFTMNFGTNDATGADGIAFIIQTVGNQAVGNSGGGLGFYGFSPSLGIEFDTWDNSREVGVSGDLASDHIAVLQNGHVFHLTSDNLAGPVQASITNENIEDGRDHTVRISWQPQTQTLRVYFDCNLRITLQKDIVKDIFKNNADVWWGFSASTGGGVNNQTVCLKNDIYFKNEIETCANQPIQMISRVAIDNQYLWKPARGLDNPNIRNPKVTQPTETTLYTVSYRNGCNILTTDSVLVSVNNPQFDLGNDKNICEGDSVLISPNNLNLTAYRWQTGENTPTLSVKKAGIYKLSAQLNNCEAKDSVKVTVQPQPVVLPNETLCLDKPLIADISGQDLSFFWEHSGQTTRQITVASEGVYRVKITNSAGCSRFRNFNVTGPCAVAIWVPDVFTPNQDAINPTFKPIVSGGTVSAMDIYNRWGTLIWRQEKNNPEWDGSIDGKPLPNDIYPFVVYYQIPSDTTLYRYRGKIQVLR